MNWITGLVIAGIGLVGGIVIKIQHSKIKRLKAELEAKSKSLENYKEAVSSSKKVNDEVMRVEGMTDEEIKENWYLSHLPDDSGMQNNK